jgi:WD40 repeat protein/tRNA A-37 threonylcarbamoyl transferase component Bud32
MVQTEATHNSRDSSWVEVLHAAIAADTATACDPTPTSLPQEFDEVRDCLHLLNRLRQEQRQPAERARKIGRFQVVREVGRGGFGVVLAAVDPRVGRQVAVKIPRPEVLSTHATRNRFLREAQAAGALSHPNLIAIHEVGEDGPVCYIVSELCRGTNLAQWLASRESRLSERSAVEIVIPLARAVAHAHRRGVMHRDIKPSNVLLEPGETGLAGLAACDGMIFRPLLTDFGLARISEFMEEHTCTGTLLGTPAYMAPEQAEGCTHNLSPATDIYALGVILYELLAGAPPLRGATDLQTLQLVARGEVPPLKSRRPGVSRDLAAIAHKCLETSPARRYASADELADDLERFQSGQPTKARPTGSAVRAAKWCRRRPMAAALIAVVLCSTAVLADLSWRYLEQRRVARQSQQHRDDIIDQRLYAASMNLAADSLAVNQSDKAREQLDAWIPRDGATDRRSFAWHYLKQQLDGAQLTIEGHQGDVYRVEFSPDGKLLATASADKSARIWDAESGLCRRVLRGHKSDVNSIAFHPSGERVVTAGDDGQVIIWNMTTGERVKTITLREKIFTAAFSPDGETLAVCGEGRALKLYDAETIKLDSNFISSSQDAENSALAFSASGKWLVAGCENGELYHWTVKTKKLRDQFKTRFPVNTISISPDEKWLIAGHRNRRHVSLFDLTERHGAGYIYRSFDWIHDVKFHPSGDYFAVATKDGIVDFFEPHRKQPIRQIRGHNCRVWSVAFRPDGQRLATAAADHKIRIWDLEHGPLAWHSISLATPEDAPVSVRLTGRFAATWADSSFAVVDLDRNKTVWTGSPDYEVVGDFDGDGVTDEGSFYEGTWRIFPSGVASDRSSPQLITFGTKTDWPITGDWDGDGRDNLGVYQPANSELALDVDGFGNCPERVLQSPEKAGKAAVPIAARWQGMDRDCPGTAVYYARPPAWSVNLHRDDHWRQFTVGQIPQGQIPLFGRGQTGSHARLGLRQGDDFWFSGLPKGKWKASQANPSLLSLDAWLKPSFKSHAKLPVPMLGLVAAYDLSLAHVTSLSVSTDGNRLAVVERVDRRVRIRELPSGLRIANVGEPDVNASYACFDPTGTYLTVGTVDGQIIFYDAISYHRLHALQPLDGTVSGLHFASDGQSLICCDVDGNIAFIHTADFRSVRLITDRGEDIDCIAVSHDAELIAAAAFERPPAIFSAETGTRIASLVGQADRTLSIAFSPDGRVIATSGGDGRVQLWDTATWSRLLSLHTGGAMMSDLSFSDDGSELLAVGLSPPSEPDRELISAVWRISPQSLQQSRADARP